MYGPSQFGWNLSAAESDVFSKTHLRTGSPARNIRCFTRLLYRFVILCWYDAIRTAAASRNLSIISKSLARASVLASSGISVRSVGIPIYVGIMASIP